jgi:4-hydroxybenzoate polyprenyltransferase
VTRLATVLLVLSILAGLGALAGSDVELSRFGWPPPLILTGAVLAIAAYQVGKELGDLADARTPVPPTPSEDALLPDPRA